MKTKQTVFFIMLTAFSLGIQAQSTKTKKDTVAKKEDNMMDMVSKTLGFALGGLEQDIDGTKDPFKGITNFEDFMNKGNLDPQTKATYRAMYQMQAQEPSQKRKDSIRSLLDSLIKKDMMKNTSSDKKQNR